MFDIEIIRFSYGSKWLPAVAALQVLCFYGLIRSLLATTENLYLATGKPQVRTKLNLLQLVLMALLMYRSRYDMGSWALRSLPRFPRC